MVRAGLLRPSFAAIALAIAVFACGAPAPAQITHADSGDVKTQDRLASDPAGAVERARKRVAGGDLDGAVKELALYVGGHPRELEPARYLADLYYRQTDFASAERTLIAILTFAPKDRETHNRLGGIYAVQDKITAAIDEFQKSLPYTGAYEHLVALHRIHGDLGNFVDGFRRDAENKPYDVSAQLEYGKVLAALRRPLDAIDYFQRALSLEMNSCSVLADLGSAYLDVNQVPKAVEVLQRCLNHESNNYNALVNLGDAYIEQGQLPKSRDALERASRARPDGPEALVDLGYIEDMQGHWQPAVQYYLRAIALDPLCRDAYVNLGYDYDEHRLFQLAEASFIKGLSIAPSDGRLHYLLAVTYHEQGKKDLAKVEYERAKTSDEPEVARAATRDLALMQRTQP
jgi:tetratricopeptide (TPR) repeat protein